MQYQIIILTLRDGRVIKAVVPAFSKPGDEIYLAKVEVTEPMDMPPDTSFGPLHDEPEKRSDL